MNNPKRKIEIYQLTDTEENHRIMFCSYEWAQEKGVLITSNLYEQVYSCERERNYPLEAIYQEFNINHPADYEAHSLSVSDVVVITQDGITTAYYVDDFGFEELPNFFADRGDDVTPERLEEANRLSDKIKMLRKRLEDLAYLQEAPEVSISAKDGRKTYESYVTVPVGCFRNLILNELRYQLERQLHDAERQLKDL